MAVGHALLTLRTPPSRSVLIVCSALSRRGTFTLIAVSYVWLPLGSVQRCESVHTKYDGVSTVGSVVVM